MTKRAFFHRFYIEAAKDKEGQSSDIEKHKAPLPAFEVEQNEQSESNIDVGVEGGG